MLAVAAVRDGTKRNDYPETRAAYEGRRPPFSWRRSKVGRDVLILMSIWIERRKSAYALGTERDFKTIGVTKENLGKLIRKHIPQIIPEYENATGAKFTDDLLKCRVHQWFLKHRGKGLGCDAGVKPEHPSTWADQSRVAYWSGVLQKDV